MRNIAHVGNTQIGKVARAAQIRHGGAARRIRTIAHAAALCAGALAIAACEGEEAATGPVAEAPAVPLVSSSGEIIGEVRGGDSDEGATLLVEARGLPAGVHGMHLHDIGICEPPNFESAGPHWNPTGAEHGGQNPQGAHLGDLQNVNVGADGRLRVQIVVPGTYLRTAGRDVPAAAHQLFDADGAALVIHAQPDDYRTNPSGSSGARIACAELAAPTTAAPTGDGNAAATELDAVDPTLDNAAASEPTVGNNGIVANVGVDTSPPE